MRKYTILVIIIVLAALGLVWYKGQHKKTQIAQGKILADKDRHLSAEAIKIYNDRIKKAEDNLRSLKPTDPAIKTEQVNDYMYLGEQYFGLGQLEQSKQQYLQVLQLDSNNESALVGLALTYSDAGDFNDARANLETALRNNPKNYNLWLQYIDLRKASGASNDELNQIYDEALKATDNYPDLLTRDAQFQESQGNIAGAIALWQQAVKKNPDGAAIYNPEIARLQKLKK